MKSIFGNCGNRLVTEKEDSTTSTDSRYIDIIDTSYQVTRLYTISTLHARAHMCVYLVGEKLGNLVTGAFLCYRLAVLSGYQVVTGYLFGVTSHVD